MCGIGGGKGHGSCERGPRVEDRSLHTGQSSVVSLAPACKRLRSRHIGNSKSLN